MSVQSRGEPPGPETKCSRDLGALITCKQVSWAPKTVGNGGSLWA